MLVDDDADMCEMLSAFLRRQHIGVVTHSRGSEALRDLEAERVDALIVDKEMPETSGLEVVSRARSRRPDLPIVVVTAFGGGTHAAAQAMARGASAYLEKPFSVYQLLSTLRALTGDAG